MLQKGFTIVRGPAEYRSSKVLWQIMICNYIILHNMIIQGEGDMHENFRYITNETPDESEYDPNRIQAFLEKHHRIEN